MTAAAGAGLSGNLGHGRGTVDVNRLANRRFGHLKAMTDHVIGLGQKRVFLLKFHVAHELENQSQQFCAYP